MAKIVGLSGAQGAGKSELLKELMARGWRLDQFRVSRAVQESLGWRTLNNVLDSVQTMKSFQSEVFRQKFNHDFALSTMPANDKSLPALGPRAGGITLTPRATDVDPGIVLTERTFADIYAYTKLWCWKFHDRGEMLLSEIDAFLGPFRESCLAAQRQCYSSTLLLPFMGHMPWDNDPNRADQQDTDTVYSDITRFMLEIDQPQLIIRAKSIADRATDVDTFIRSL